MNRNLFVTLLFALTLASCASSGKAAEEEARQAKLLRLKTAENHCMEGRRALGGRPPDYEKAIIEARAALALAQEDPQYFSSALQYSKTLLAEAYRIRADQKASKGDYAGAAADMEELIKTVPEDQYNQFARYQLSQYQEKLRTAQLRQEQKRREQEQQEQRRQRAAALANEGDAHFASGRHSEAGAAYNQALRLNSANAAAKSGLDRITEAAAAAERVRLFEKRFTYSDNADGTVTITQFSFANGLDIPRDLVIPAELGGKPVTAIADKAFRNPEVDTLGSGVGGRGVFILNGSLTIPEGVTTIGNWAFANNALVSVSIPSTVTSIGTGAFSKNRLTSIVIPGSLTSIEAAAFSGNGLTSIVIPESITSIGNYAFSGNGLTSLTFGKNVTAIGNGAFEYNRLTGVTLPGSLVTIGDNAFAHNQLTSLVIPGNVTAIGKGAFSGDTGRSNVIASLTIGRSVSSIGESAFSGNYLTSVTIPPSVRYLSGFDLSRNLTSITIPNSVTEIGNNAFTNSQLTSITIPNGVTAIGDFAFKNNKLTSLAIPNSVTRIGKEAFKNCPLTSLTLGSRVAYIGEEAFESCKFTSVVIPNSLTHTGSFPFPRPVTLIIGANLNIEGWQFGGSRMYSIQNIYAENGRKAGRYEAVPNRQSSPGGGAVTFWGWDYRGN